MKFKLVIFDFNGTLVKDLSIVYGAIVSMFKEHGAKPPSLKLFRNTPSVPLEWYYEQGFPRSVTEKKLTETFNKYTERIWRRQRPRLRPGAHILLKYCKRNKIRAIIVSALNSSLMEKRSEQMGLKRLFEEIHGGIHDKGRAIKEITQRHGLSPKESIYIGDTAGDVRFTKEAGATSIAITTGYNEPRLLLAAKPDFLVKSMPEALNILKRLRREKGLK